MNPRHSPRYFLASVALLAVLVTLHVVSGSRRTQAELRQQLEQTGQTLADAIETSSKNAVKSDTLMEETVAQRLLDNARLIDELLAWPRIDPGEVERVARRNHLRRVDLLDRDGHPWTPPPPPAGGMRGMMRMMMQPGGGDDSRALSDSMPMMRFMWGRRWTAPDAAEREGPAPPAIQDRKFWEGTVFGVAIGARSFPGIIAVHADADYILDFRREIGVQRQVEELGQQAGIASIALLAPDLTVVAHSDPSRVGQRLDDPVLRRASATRQALTRMVNGPDHRSLFEIVRPLPPDHPRLALLAIDLSTAPMERAWRSDLRAGMVLGGAVVLVGAAGLGLVFWIQQRHLRDVRTLEAAMARRERVSALGDVAAAFAHEVRNPLNAVSMGLQRLAAEFTATPADEYTRFVELMQGEVRRLNTIVEQFISLARPLPLRPEPTEPGLLLRELATLLEGEVRAAGCEVALDLPESLPAIVVDRDHLKQVLLNLALNGLQAMTPGGRLTLGARATREGVTFTVEDSGPGIAPEILPRIFDPYFSTKPRGLGLGLSIARRIVEEHGGSLEAESEPGHGARFLLRLPGKGA